MKSDDFWFFELLSGSCEGIKSEQDIISNSLRWIRVTFFVCGVMD